MWMPVWFSPSPEASGMTITIGAASPAANASSAICCMLPFSTHAVWVSLAPCSR